MIQFLFAFFIGAPAGIAFGGDCSTVKDLDKDLGPVRQQADTSWCYAFTASDMVTQLLHKRGVLKSGERIHASSIAAVTYLSRGQLPEENVNVLPDVLANPTDALRNVREAGYRLCKDSEMISTRGSGPGFLAQHSSRVLDIARGGSLPCPGSDQSSERIGRLSGDLREVSKATWKKTFEERCSVPAPHFDRAFRTLDERSKMINSGKEPKKNAAFEAKVLAEITDGLDGGSIVGIGYDAALVRPGSKHESHWSSIVGRVKKADGTCSYQIRNSWGADCGLDKPNPNCKAGVMTVSEKDLLRSVHSTQFLMPDEPLRSPTEI